MAIIRALALSLGMVVFVAAEEPILLTGVWGLSAKSLEECTCINSNIGETVSYTWNIKQVGNSTVHIFVDGNTGFPRLLGHWNSVNRTLIVDGYATEGEAACWFKLILQADGTLKGIRRYISGTNSPDNRPCFVDYQVIGIRQPTNEQRLR